MTSIVSILFERTTEQREDTVIRARELTEEERRKVLQGVTEEFDKPKVAPMRRV